MNRFLFTYFLLLFNAERYESMVFVAVGLIAIGLSIFFWFSGSTRFQRGLMMPLVLVALIQLTVGFTVLLRSPKDLARVEGFVTNDPPQIEQQEIPRMKKVLQNFVVYRYVEIALILAGALILVFLNNDPLWRGIGLGLGIQASLMLSMDYFAERRGKTYLQELATLAKSFQKSV